MRHRRVALGLVALLCLADESSGPRILRPADQSIVPAGTLSVVARTIGKAELRLDGKAIGSSAAGPNALTASVTPGPGRHELALISGGAEHKLQIFVKGARQPPAAWKEFRAHPPAAATCETCHAVKEGAWSFIGATSCFGCHDAKQFAKPHSHNSDTLEECQTCHSAHGSTEMKHLKMKKEVACKLCHG